MFQLSLYENISHKSLTNSKPQNKKPQTLIDCNSYSNKMSVSSLSLLFYIVVLIKLSSSFNVTLLHVNDVHSHFEEVNVNTGTCKDDMKERGECYGGVSRMASYISQVRQSDPDTLLLNGGDFYQGTMWYTVFKGRSGNGITGISI